MRSKVILVLALIMGAITTLLFFNYMKQFDEATVISETMVDVVVAKQEIKENQRISSGMVEVIQIPEKGLHLTVIKSIAEAEGRYATAAITAGEPILSHRVKSEKEETLYIARKVKDGYRAISVGVNFVQSVSNLIEPEDKVDVVFNEVKKNANNEPYVITNQILSGVRVLAIGRKMLPTMSEEEEYVEYSSVTLELKPENAMTLINAIERGTIHFTIHTKVIPEEKNQSETSQQ